MSCIFVHMLLNISMSTSDSCYYGNGDHLINIPIYTRLHNFCTVVTNGLRSNNLATVALRFKNFTTSVVSIILGSHPAKQLHVISCESVMLGM